MKNLLQESINDGSFYSSDFDDFLDFAAVAASKSKYPKESFAELVDARMVDMWPQDLDNVKANLQAFRNDYHAATRKSLQRVTGVSDQEFDDALTARDAGDPSIMTKIQSAYLSAI